MASKLILWPQESSWRRNIALWRATDRASSRSARVCAAIPASPGCTRSWTVWGVARECAPRSTVTPGRTMPRASNKDSQRTQSSSPFARPRTITPARTSISRIAPASTITHPLGRSTADHSRPQPLLAAAANGPERLTPAMHERSAEWLRHPWGHDPAASSKIVQVLSCRPPPDGNKALPDLVGTEPFQRPNDVARGSLWRCQIASVERVTTPPDAGRNAGTGRARNSADGANRTLRR